MRRNFLSIFVLIFCSGFITILITSPDFRTEYKANHFDALIGPILLAILAVLIASRIQTIGKKK